MIGKEYNTLISQVKQEIHESIVHCLLKCKHEDALDKIWLLIKSFDNKDAYLWQMLVKFYKQTDNIIGIILTYQILLQINLVLL